MAEKDMSWVPPGVDTGKASIARVYDYWLGGTHNFQADRDAARSVIVLQPNIRAIARANRAFLSRAVRFLALAGIRQFLDIGSGIPTEGNVHEVAQQAAPGSRVVYVDIDPVAVAHSRAILSGHGDAGAIRGDLRDPAAILGSREVRQLIDFSQPVGLLLAAVLHFIPDDEDPWRIVRSLRDAMTGGSYLVVSHATSDGMAAASETTLVKVYQDRVSARGELRPRAGIERFFGGFDLIEPGLVYLSEWRPGGRPGRQGDPAQLFTLGGVGRKPGP